MADLTVDDVARYTGNRLDASDDDTQDMLSAALAAARNDVGWHVSPIRTAQVIRRNGPGGYKLRLPTQNIVKLNSITNDGTAVDVDTDVVVDAEVGWLVHKVRGGAWSCEPAGIVVNLDHGFTEKEAADWRRAILSLVDQMSTMVTVGRPDSEMTGKTVDDVDYRFNAEPFLPSVEPILAKYRVKFGAA